MAEVDSSKNVQNEGEFIPNLREYNVNNAINNINNNLNNRRTPRPTFIESTTKKVSDIIDQINTIPEADLQSWNLVADYTP